MMLEIQAQIYDSNPPFFVAQFFQSYHRYRNLWCICF